MKQAEGNCWLFAGTIGTRGYGRLVYYINSQIYRTSAHRAMYEAMVGEVPEGLVLDHLCRVTSCINPDHLEPVTRKENNLRGIGVFAINAQKTHCIRGHEFDHTTRIRKSDNARLCRTCRNLENVQYRLNRKLRQQAHSL